MPETILLPTASVITCTSAFNANYDIVWSFQYSLCGGANASAGFTTFLYSNSNPISAGGIGKALGYGPSTNYTGYSNISAISGAVLAVAFDTDGAFAATGNGFTTGTTAYPNSLTIRSGMTYLSSTQLSAIDSNFTLLSTAEVFNTLRFRLTNVGQSITISKLNQSTMKFVDIYNANTYLNVLSSTTYQIGISYASPVSGNNKAFALQIKDLHLHGTSEVPTTVNY